MVVECADFVTIGYDYGTVMTTYISNKEVWNE